MTGTQKLITIFLTKFAYVYKKNHVVSDFFCLLGQGVSCADALTKLVKVAGPFALKAVCISPTYI